jgi:hypothetical protein
VSTTSVESPPIFEQGSTYSAEQLRHAFGTLLQRGSSIGSVVGGLVGSGDMLVTAGSGMQVLVAPGEAWITGSSTSTQGGYYARVTSSTALAISASNASNPRIETIIAQIKDKSYAGTEETFSVSVVVGTAEAGATLANLKGAGAVPASSLVLAYMLVPAKAVSIEAANVENRATLAGIGLSPLPMTTHSSSGTMKSGEAWEMDSTATVTLGAPFLGSEYELFSNSISTTTVKPASGAIYGQFVSGASTITLLPLQGVRIRGDGLNYLIVAGEPKREAVYSAIASPSEGEKLAPSPTRSALVIFRATFTAGGGKTNSVLIKVGGVNLPALNGGTAEGEGVARVTFIVPPAQEWEWVKTVGTAKAPSEVEASTLVL